MSFRDLLLLKTPLSSKRMIMNSSFKLALALPHSAFFWPHSLMFPVRWHHPFGGEWLQIRLLTKLAESAQSCTGWGQSR